MLRGVPFQLLEPEDILRVLHPLRHVQILLAVRYHRVLWVSSEPSVATAPPLEGWCIVRIPPGILVRARAWCPDEGVKPVSPE